MSSDLVTHESSTHDLQSWNRKILSFDLDALEAGPEDGAAVDQRIERSLAALFGEQAPVEYDPCDEFHCSSYWPVM